MSMVLSHSPKTYLYTTSVFGMWVCGVTPGCLDIHRKGGPMATARWLLIIHYLLFSYLFITTGQAAQLIFQVALEKKIAMNL